MTKDFSETAVTKAPTEIDTRLFSYAEQLWFAEVSGDINPIHVDAENVLNSFLGQPVVHGLHLVLWSLDRLGRTHTSWLQKEPAGRLRVRFSKPVFLEERITLSLVNSTRHEIAVELGKNHEVLCRITIVRKGFEKRILSIPTGISKINAAPSVPRAWEISQVQDLQGAIEFPRCSEKLRSRYPALTKILPECTLDSLAALSMLVGMEIPGERSLFGGFDIELEGNAEKHGLHYRVMKVHPRFSKIIVGVSAPGLKGEVSAFFTPKRCVQQSFTYTRSLVRPNTFSSARALVIGGSKGLGEATAKILAAGGASVVLTYAQSKKSAERIVREIQEGGGVANLSETNILKTSSVERLRDSLTNHPTHVFYFPTPKIFVRRTADFELKLFHEFCAFYVDGFFRVVSSLREITQESIYFFYPSSVVVDKPHRALSEYRLAKLAGEALCEELSRSMPKNQITVERLPRLKSDQTQSLVATPSADPTPILLRLFEEYYGA